MDTRGSPGTFVPKLTNSIYRSTRRTLDDAAIGANIDPGSPAT
jgi:hypothetical protein